MNVSLNWLSSYIDLAGLGTQEMADMLTFAGIEVEGIQERGVTTDLVVVAQVMEKTPVEGSDHLNVCMVDAGEGSLRQIVCGAQNYKVGDKVPCALPGAVLPWLWRTWLPPVSAAILQNSAGFSLPTISCGSASIPTIF